LILKGFSIVILTKNKTPISEATNKGIICTIVNCKRQAHKWGITCSVQR